jgi:hypothetical protein
MHRASIDNPMCRPMVSWRSVVVGDRDQLVWRDLEESHTAANSL